MRIANGHSMLINLPLGAGRGGSGATAVELIHVALTDEEGRRGTGFTYALTGGGVSIQSMIDKVFLPKLLGCDPHTWHRLWYDLWNMTHRLGRGVALPALSALDIAIWDLRGICAEQPLYRLLGQYREKVRIYGSGRSTHQMTTEQLIDGTRSYIEEGYDAVKLRAGARSAEEDAERITAVRRAVGDSIRIMVDCNERLDFATALWLGRRLEDLGIYWLEEPLISDDIAGHSRLAAQLRIPIAVGEHLQGRFEFAEYIRQAAAAILQPDAPLMGGVTEWMRVATLAEAFGVSLSPHFLPELHVHLAAAAKSCSYLEHFPLIDDLLVETLHPQQGFATPPDRPGHGILWDAERLEHFRVH